MDGQGLCSSLGRVGTGLDWAAAEEVEEEEGGGWNMFMGISEASGCRCRGRI